MATEWLQGDQFDGTMNYPLRSAILDFASGRMNASAFVNALETVRDATPSWARPGMLNLLGSHDTERVLTHLRDDQFALRIATALQLTSEGAPMVYYGDELGLVGGADPDNRRPMPWDPTQWNHEVLAWTRALIDLRKSQPALRGDQEQVEAVGDDTVIRRRGCGAETVILLINRGRVPVEIPTAAIPERHRVVLGDQGSIQIQDERLTLAGRSLAVIGNA